jgi:hypothetical protein
VFGGWAGKGRVRDAWMGGREGSFKKKRKITLSEGCVDGRASEGCVDGRARGKF